MAKKLNIPYEYFPSATGPCARRFIQKQRFLLYGAMITKFYLKILVAEYKALALKMLRQLV